jgi:hypothetical protein
MRASSFSNAGGAPSAGQSTEAERAIWRRCSSGRLWLDANWWLTAVCKADVGLGEILPSVDGAREAHRTGAYALAPQRIVWTVWTETVDLSGRSGQRRA